MASPYQQPKPKHGVKVFGRPSGSLNHEIKSESFRLHCILPANVRDELLRVESETTIYRTRIAAKIICDWADQQRQSRMH